MTEDVLSLGGVCRAWVEKKRLPLEPGADPKRRGWEGGVVSMGLTSGSEAAWGARPADVSGEGLELTVHVMGRLGEGAVRLATGGRFSGVKTGESTHMGFLFWGELPRSPMA